MTTRAEAERLYVAVFYEGPWEKVMNWFWYLSPNQTYRDVRPGGLRDRLAMFAERRHHAWVERVRSNPDAIPSRWRRRASETAT